MSRKKNATDDPPRSPPDQGGAVNRSFSIHEIQDMSDDDADGYRAALDERAARRARRCALSAPQAAEAPARPVLGITVRLAGSQSRTISHRRIAEAH